jgi:hypothetical protein
METIAMNVSANGIVAVNKAKKDDSPSHHRSSPIFHGKAFQGRQQSQSSPVGD